MSTTIRNLILWAIIVVALILSWNIYQKIKDETGSTITFSEFNKKLKDKQIRDVKISTNQAEGKFTDGAKFKTIIPADQRYTLAEKLDESGARVDLQPPEQNSLFYGFVGTWLPILLILGFWIFLMRQMQSGGNKALSFGKSRARMFAGHQKKVTFKDVAGVDEAKEELTEVIEFLKEPQKFQKLGGRIPKGVMLVGPPGTGKTLLARAIAGEANVPFFSISGSDFVEMFVGVGASRVRDLFEQGKKHAPCIIFIDEIDAVGRHRGAGLGGGHDEREQTLNQLLVELDGFESNEGVIIIAATNRPDVLDPALLRAGRFDRQVVVNLPDVRGREEILKVHTKKIPLADDVELSVLARGAPGFSGAHLANLVNEAALSAARKNRKTVLMEDFEGAKDKVLMGKERKSLVLSEQDKKIIAYHEAGHALVAYVLKPVVDPLHKVTIIPRGLALGLTQTLPLEDKHNYTKEYIVGWITQAMGGRCAEELIFGADHVTTGASNDLEKATEMARKMVCEWGMSESMGPLTFGKREEMVFLGREIAQHKDYSEDTAVKIDIEVKKIASESLEKARQVLRENREALVRVAEALLEFEVLDGYEIDQVMQCIPIDVDKHNKKVSSDGKRGSVVEDKPAQPSMPNLVNPKNKPAPA
ncbi:MAG: ATP-dependent metallopeptidase FtsH/Yme1/Tma family protein [Acidobacteria bacterium]|nr:ATP-dependent metallopeptidase FtsH/Yme1/Tma family protein [Acidobacteriota bacterium]MBI3656523.1 ATP-dependent metallopeptidase FtsH/Yme1/Tma family protein [Acidobacteriota bacterium]